MSTTTTTRKARKGQGGAKAKAAKATTTRKPRQAKAETPAKGKATPKAPGKARLTGKERTAVAKKVVAMREAKKNPASWATIARETGCGAPRTARALYDEIRGPGAHHGLLPGKGGRTPAQAKG